MIRARPFLATMVTASQYTYDQVPGVFGLTKMTWSSELDKPGYGRL
jgi:hypothetical protein